MSSLLTWLITESVVGLWIKPIVVDKYNTLMDTVIKPFLKNPVVEFIMTNIFKIVGAFFYLILSFIISCFISSFFVFIILTYHRPPTQFDHPVFLIKSERMLSSNITLLTHDTSRTLIQSGLFIEQFKIRMHMPFSSVNNKIGMFTIHAEFFDEDLNMIYSTSRSSLIKYKSKIYSVVETILSLPLLLTGYKDESEFQSIDMLTETQLEHFNNQMLHKANFIHVWISNPNLQVYSANIQLSAQVTGIWYYFYYHPFISFFILFPIFLCWSMIGFFIFGLILLYSLLFKESSSEQVVDASTSTTQPKTKSGKKKQPKIMPSEESTEKDVKETTPPSISPPTETSPSEDEEEEEEEEEETTETSEEANPIEEFKKASMELKTPSSYLRKRSNKKME